MLHLYQLEIALILGLIVWQGYVFVGNRRLIQRVRTMYPPVEQLKVEVVHVSNRATPQPEAGTVIPLRIEDLDSTPIAPSLKYDAVAVTAGSPEFLKVITDTNDYLQANKGAAAAFDTLRDISEREANLLDEEIQAQIATPLYLGLIGTFGGAIMGLFALLNPLARESGAAGSFSNAGVADFLGGVLIAMVGSIFGLGFTLVGNQLLKVARAQRDRLKNGYYNFLQKALLPRLNSDMQNSMSSLKAVLDTFNQDFFSKIQVDFFSKIAEFTPLISRITENISIQKDFLEKLQTIGYTQLANATIKVFDRVDASAASFEKFLGYQQALNVAVSQGADTARTVTALLDRLSTLENSLNQVPGYLQKHDAFIREQVNVFTQHTQLLDLMRGGINEALSEDAAKMRQVLDNRLKAFDTEARTAAEQWNEHFYRLKQDNVYQRIVEYLTPFQKLPAQQQALNQLQEVQARRSAEALQALQQPLEQNRQIQERLLQQTERTNAVLEKLTQRNWFQRMVG